MGKAETVSSIPKEVDNSQMYYTINEASINDEVDEGIEEVTDEKEVDMVIDTPVGIQVAEELEKEKVTEIETKLAKEESIDNEEEIVLDDNADVEAVVVEDIEDDDVEEGEEDVVDAVVDDVLEAVGNDNLVGDDDIIDDEIDTD